MNRARIFLLMAFAFWASLMRPDAVLAALGESGDSVATDRAALHAERRPKTEREGYTVHEMQSPSVTVREYSSPSNVVFAVAWNGMVPPDLDQLLGRYADDYKQALKREQRKPGRRSSSQVKTDTIVVETWGHMRNLQGRAYVPGLVPPGVDIDEIK